MLFDIKMVGNEHEYGFFWCVKLQCAFMFAFKSCCVVMFKIKASTLRFFGQNWNFIGKHTILAIFKLFADFTQVYIVFH